MLDKLARDVAPGPQFGDDTAAPRRRVVVTAFATVVVEDRPEARRERLRLFKVALVAGELFSVGEAVVVPEAAGGPRVELLVGWRLDEYAGGRDFAESR